MRVLVGIVLGFLGATIAVTALSLVGFPNPTFLGALHLVLWALMAVSYTRRGSTTAKSDTQPGAGSTTTQAIVPEESFLRENDEPLLTQQSVSDAGLDSPPSGAEPDNPELPTTSNAKEAATGSPREWPMLAILIVSFFILPAIVAVSGFVGAKYAIDQAVATTTATTTTEAVDPTDVGPDGLEDLTNAEWAWCFRDDNTKFAMIKAVDVLGFYDFSTNLYDWRDGDADAMDDFLDDYERWGDEDGADEQIRELAVACRAAFDGR